MLVKVRVERVIGWPDARCEGEPSVTGAPLPQREPEPQAEPKGGTAPRVDAARAARRLAKLPHVLLGYRGADGLPVVVSVGVGEAGPNGIELRGPLPAMDDGPGCWPTATSHS